MQKLLLFTFFAFQFSSSLLAQAGSLDPSFGTWGISLQDFGYSSTESVDAMAESPDGMLVIGGRQRDLGTDDRCMVARLTANGEKDLTFGDQGLAMIDIEGTVEGLAVQPDGKIVVASGGGSGVNNDFLRAFRLTQEGELDASFGNGGIVDITFNNTVLFCEDMQLLDDGKIIIVGVRFLDINTTVPILVQLNPGGTLDSSFGNNGATQFPGESFVKWYVNSLKVQSDGKILIAGAAGTAGPEFGIWALMRVLPNGLPDPTFGVNGISYNVIGLQIYNEEAIQDIEIQEDGKIVAAGFYNPNWLNSRPIVARYTPEGTLDPTFGQGGKRYITFNDSICVLRKVLVQPDQKILVAGNANIDNLFSELFVLRMTPDGDVDNSFGTSGAVTAGFPNANDYGNAALYHSDEKITVAGRSDAVGFPSEENVLLARFTTGDALAASQVPIVASEIHLSPNPIKTDGTLSFKISDRTQLGIVLFDSMGRLKKDFSTNKYYQPGQHYESLEFGEGLTSGIYYLKITDGNSTVSVQVFKK